MTIEEEFFRKFDMRVQASQRKLRRIPNMWHHDNAWKYEISDSVTYQHQTFPNEEVDCVEVLMPKDRLQHIIDYIKYSEDEVERAQTDRQLVARYERDRSVRLANPAVEKAYQKYVMLLELARK
jgi:hypothetical protein